MLSAAKVNELRQYVKEVGLNSILTTPKESTPKCADIIFDKWGDYNLNLLLAVSNS